MAASDGGRRTMRRNIRELPPMAWFLIGGSFINRFGSAYGGGEVIAGGIGGYLADRIGGGAGPGEPDPRRPLTDREFRSPGRLNLPSDQGGLTSSPPAIYRFDISA
jgi:hypothetical protein